MIPDFPEAKKRLKRILDEQLRLHVRKNSPVASMAMQKILHEGDSLGVLHPSGEHVVTGMREASSEFVVRNDEIPTMTGEELLSRVEGLAKEMAAQMERSMLETINESAEKVGNVMSRGGRLSPQTLLDAMETIRIDFQDDDREKPVKPSLITDEETLRSFQEEYGSPTTDETADFNAKEKVILDRKYAEYMDDLNTRKIID